MGLCSHPQPPLVQTQRVTITAESNSLPSGSTTTTTTEVPVVPTKTIIYESSKVGAPAPAQPRSEKPWAQRRQVWDDQAPRLQAEHDARNLDWCELTVTFYKQTLNRWFLLAGVRWRDRKRQHDHVQLHKRYLGNHQWHHHHDNHHSHLKGESMSTHNGWVQGLKFFFFFRGIVDLKYEMCLLGLFWKWQNVFDLSGCEKWLHGDSCGEKNCHNCRLWHWPRQGKSQTAGVFPDERSSIISLKTNAGAHLSLTGKRWWIISFVNVSPAWFIGFSHHLQSVQVQHRDHLSLYTHTHTPKSTNLHCKPYITE